MAGIQWHTYDAMYAQAVAEMNVDAAMEGLVQNHIARILANVHLLQQQQQQQSDYDGSIFFFEQLVTFRRLSLLLDQNTEALQMEKFGSMLESCRIVLTESQPFNVSPSPLHNHRTARNGKAPSTLFETAAAAAVRMVGGGSAALLLLWRTQRCNYPWREEHQQRRSCSSFVLRLTPSRPPQSKGKLLLLLLLLFYWKIYE